MTGLRLGEVVDWYMRAVDYGLKSFLAPEVVLKRRIHDANTGIKEREHRKDYLRALKASLGQTKKERKESRGACLMDNNQVKVFSGRHGSRNFCLRRRFLREKNPSPHGRAGRLRLNFDQLDAGSQRLLPLLYRNLVNQNVNHPAIDIYKGFYRMTWYKNRLISHRITTVLRLLDAHSIPVTAS